MERYEKLDELMMQSDTTDKLQELEEWIAEAEEQNQHGWQYDLRTNQTEVAMNLARYDLVMDNFSWCLDLYEQNKERIYIKPLLWQFKWFLEKIDIFPRISLLEIEEYYQYFKELLSENGYTNRSYYQLKTYQAYKAGEMEKVKEYRTLWLEQNRDDMSDCEHCEKSQLMMIAFELGELNEGFDLAKEMLDGSFHCENVPHIIYPYLLLPGYNSDKVEQAKMWQQQGYFLIRKNPKYLIELSHMLLFLSVTDIKKAYELFLDHIEIAEEQTDLYSRFYFYLASWCMVERAEMLRYPIAEELEWFVDNVPAIAEEFDERNNNNHFQETMEEWLGYIDEE